MQDVDRLPRQGSLDVTAFVSDFSVSEEKTSSVRYLAKLDVQFKPKQVRDLLLGLGIPFAETQSKPIMIIPILQSSQAFHLWKDTDMWRKASIIADATLGICEHGEVTGQTLIDEEFLRETLRGTPFQNMVVNETQGCTPKQCLQRLPPIWGLVKGP